MVFGMGMKELGFLINGRIPNSLRLNMISECFCPFTRSIEIFDYITDIHARLVVENYRHKLK